MTTLNQLFETGKMGLTPELVRARRHTASMLRQLHSRGWLNPYQGKDNPLSGHVAEDARAMLDVIEQALGDPLWRFVVWMAAANGDIEDCEIFIGSPDCKSVEWLCHGLDKAGPMVGVRMVKGVG